jgi:phosphoenolpyruvate synthase/pyruvate phosphate dikinase
MGAEEQAQWRKATAERGKIALDTSKTNVDDRELKTLEQTTAADSGVRSGPKAANLGELKRFFPNRVAPGIVIPFGVYYQHASRKDSSGLSVLDRVASSFAAADRMRSAGASPEQVRAFMRPRLEEIRKTIRELKLDSAFTAELTNKMRNVFGEDGSYGVFVRSDTNAEDLPQFTGAGLNLTVPNVVGTGKILQAIKDVWASPYEERAYEWRAQALVSSVEVYPSVVLLKSVSNDKSGVIATANLETLDLNELTVNTSEGVAAVVDGGVAESLLLKPNGEVRLLAQARAPYRKMLSERGGFIWLPTTGSDYVLSAREIEEVRQLAREVREKFPPEKDNQGNIMPWDIEFGFAKGELGLFQIRPLSRYRETKTLEALASIESGTASPRMVDLDASIPDK